MGRLTQDNAEPHAEIPADETPTYERVVREVAEAEAGEGWLARCEDAGCYLRVNRPLVDALVRVLRDLDPPRVEIAAGCGALTAAMKTRGVDAVATDPAPPEDVPVERLDAREALRRHRPATVLSAFIPAGSDAHAAVTDASCVRNHVILDARLNGALGTPPPVEREAVPLPEVTRWMVCRHDGWLPRATGGRLIQHGEAWLLHK